MPKLLPKADIIPQRWLTEATKLNPGDELFLEVQTKSEQKVLIKKLRELRDKLSRDEPVTASKIDVSGIVRDRRLWVVLKMLSIPTLLGYIKRSSGELEPCTVAIDPDRRRKIKLMVSDGKTVSEINELLGTPLTRAEIREHIEKSRFS